MFNFSRWLHQDLDPLIGHCVLVTYGLLGREQGLGIYELMFLSFYDIVPVLEAGEGEDHVAAGRLELRRQQEMDIFSRRQYLFHLNCIVEPEGGDETFPLGPALLRQGALLGRTQDVGHPCRERVLDLAAVLRDGLPPAGNILGVTLAVLIIGDVENTPE